MELQSPTSPVTISGFGGRIDTPHKIAKAPVLGEAPAFQVSEERGMVEWASFGRGAWGHPRFSAKGKDCKDAKTARDRHREPRIAKDSPRLEKRIWSQIASLFLGVRSHTELKIAKGWPGGRPRGRPRDGQGDGQGTAKGRPRDGQRDGQGRPDG